MGLEPTTPRRPDGRQIPAGGQIDRRDPLEGLLGYKYSRASGVRRTAISKPSDPSGYVSRWYSRARSTAADTI